MKPNEIGAKAIQMIRDNINSNNINASGKTANSLKMDATNYSLKIYTDGTGAPPSTLQHGHDGKKVPYDFIGIIKQWIIDKGLAVTPIPFSTTNPKPSLRKYTEYERGLNQMAGAISQSIKEKGTQRFRQPRSDIYTPALEFVKSEFKKMARDVVINEYLK